MHRHDRPRARGNRVLDQFFIQIEGVFADIDEHRNRAAQHERVRGRNEGVGGQDNLVAPFDIQQQRGHVERRRAGVRQQGPGAAGALLDPSMAALREGAIAGKMEIPLRLGGIDKLVARRVGQVERYRFGCHVFSFARFARAARFGGAGRFIAIFVDGYRRQ